MPNLVGMSAREATRVLTSLGMTSRPNGAGFVLEQSPAAGTVLVPRTACVLTLGRLPVPDRRRSVPMTLGDFLRATAGRAPFDAQGGVSLGDHAAAASVTSVTSDSREVARGSVFVALRGLKADGAAFARDAIARGAIAVVAETAAPAGVAGAVAASNRRAACARRAVGGVLRPPEQRV